MSELSPTKRHGEGETRNIYRMGNLVMYKEIRKILYGLRQTESEAHHTFIFSTKLKVGQGSVVGIAIGYGVDGPGIESR